MIPKKIFLIAFCGFTVILGCVNKGSYYISKETRKENVLLLNNDSIIINYSAQCLGDTLILYINSKMLNQVKYNNQFNIVSLVFQVNNLTNKEALKEIQYLGYTNHFEEFNAIDNLEKIMTAGDPIKLIYKFPSDKVENLNTLVVKMEFVIKIKGEFRKYENKSVLKKKIDYRLFPT